ncbi:FOG: FHA domain [Alteromonadaceae bacterium Bs31]|nr:FOG: FHA domain [Alteromonadaceae bacterium Bs31]
MLQLQFKDNTSKPIWLAKPEYIIGCALECSLTIKDPHIRAQHAKLVVNGERAVISNLIGDDKIRVNGVPVNKPRDIGHGDVVSVGITELVVLDPKKAAQEPPQEQTSKPQPWELLPMMTALSGKQYPIEGSMTIGRSKECEISLGVTHLSRVHAQISVTQRGLELKDLSSANGTFVNGQRIERAVLKPGDEVRFDTVSFQVSGPQQDLELTTVRPVLKAASLRKSSGDALARKHDNPPQRPEPLAPLSEGQGLPEKAASGTGLGLWLVAGVAFAAVLAYLLRNNLIQLIT